MQKQYTKLLVSQCIWDTYKKYSEREKEKKKYYMRMIPRFLYTDKLCFYVQQSWRDFQSEY